MRTADKLYPDPILREGDLQYQDYMHHLQLAAYHAHIAAIAYDNAMVLWAITEQSNSNQPEPRP